jgi:hypothetical protein
MPRSPIPATGRIAEPVGLILPDYRENSLTLSTEEDSPNKTGSRTFSFVIKIWFETQSQQSGKVFWRGHITHVPSSERKYIQVLEDIPAFIATYLEEAGVRPGLYWQLRRWFKQRG